MKKLMYWKGGKNLPIKLLTHGLGWAPFFLLLMQLLVDKKNA